MDYASILQQLNAGADPFAPTEQDRKDALTQALMAFGFNTLAARTGGNAAAAAGVGGMAGMGAYQDALGGASRSKKEGVLLRQQLAQLMRQEQEQKRQDAQRAALERAKQAGMVAPSTVNVAMPGAPGENEAPQTAPASVPGGFDAQKFLQAYMAEPDSDPLQAIDLQTKLAKTKGWQKVGTAPGGGDLYVGPDGKPEVVGKAEDAWRPVQEMDNGVLYVNLRTGEPKLVHNTAPKITTNVGGPKVVLDANARQGSEYFHKDILPKMEAAKAQNPRLQSMLRLNLDTNFFTPENKTLQSMLVAVGLGGKNAKDYIGKAEAFQADAMSVVLTEQQAQKGPQTDKDFLRIQETVPNLRNSPRGNEYIIRLRMAQNNRIIKQGQFIGSRTSKGEDYLTALQAWEASPEGQSSIFDDPVLRGFSFEPQGAGGSIRAPGNAATVGGVTVRRAP
jgi:hypothetical protein